MANNTAVLEKNPTKNLTNRELPKYMPRCDIYETKDALIVLADMPGVDENNIDITLEKNILTLTGTVCETNFDNHSLIYSEYKTGNFERVFALSDEVNKDEIKASLKNGVLKLTLPKSPVAQARKIAVKSE